MTSGHTHDYREVERVTLVDGYIVVPLDDGTLDVEYECVVCGDRQMGWVVPGVEQECGCKLVGGEPVWPCAEHKRPSLVAGTPFEIVQDEPEPDERGCWAGQRENVW